MHSEGYYAPGSRASLGPAQDIVPACPNLVLPDVSVLSGPSRLPALEAMTYLEALRSG